MKKTADKSLFYAGELFCDDTDWGQSLHEQCRWVPKTVRIQVPSIEWVQEEVRDILLINRTALLIVISDALVFFAGPANVFPFSIDLSIFAGASV